MNSNKFDSTEFEEEETLLNTSSSTEPKVVDENTKKSTFLRMANLFKLSKSYSEEIEQQLEKLKSDVESDATITKQIEINGVIISIKFKSGVPEIPKDEAFAVSLAANQLINQLIQVPEGVIKRMIPTNNLDLTSVRETIKTNSNLEDLMEH